MYRKFANWMLICEFIKKWCCPRQKAWWKLAHLNYHFRMISVFGKSVVDFGNDFGFYIYSPQRMFAYFFDGSEQMWEPHEQVHRLKLIEFSLCGPAWMSEHDKTLLVNLVFLPFWTKAFGEPRHGSCHSNVCAVVHSLHWYPMCCTFYENVILAKAK